MSERILERLAAFTDDPAGGNPAGVMLAATLPDAAEMQRIAAEVGYSETAFLAPTADHRFDVRYFAPQTEVPFCGHATIAAGVLLGRRDGPGRYVFATQAGEVAVEVEGSGERFRAALTSVVPQHRDVDPDELSRVLAAFGWCPDDLDPALAPALSYAGAWHLVLALRDRATLAAMDYDFDALRRWMQDRDAVTVQAVWRESPALFHARNPFPVGGVVEDPATGAAAAALGGYLRDRGHLTAPTSVTVRQGEDMGRPSRLEVTIPAAGGITVSGGAVPIAG